MGENEAVDDSLQQQQQMIPDQPLQRHPPPLPPPSPQRDNWFNLDNPPPRHPASPMARANPIVPLPDRHPAACQLTGATGHARDSNDVPRDVKPRVPQEPRYFLRPRTGDLSRRRRPDVSAIQAAISGHLGLSMKPVDFPSVHKCTTECASVNLPE